MDMIPGPVILTLAQDMLDCSIRSTSKEDLHVMLVIVINSRILAFVI
ncbi:12321_t:CDS:2 [Entrophospora sp. SA101]|nr:12321_t:CDS:2 [Entrophospora sp. SA101]